MLNKFTNTHEAFSLSINNVAFQHTHKVEVIFQTVQSDLDLQTVRMI